MENKIRLEYIMAKKKYIGVIDREEFRKNMQYLKDAFPDNNEIATKLLSLIPEILLIRINQDVNDTQDVPCIWYETLSGQNMLKILRYHSIIWGFLNHYCYDAMK